MIFSKKINPYLELRETDKIKEQPEIQQQEIRKMLNKYDQQRNTVLECFTLLDTERGDIHTFPRDGGIYQQPAREMTNLLIVQNEFKRYLVEKQKEEEKKMKQKQRSGKRGRGQY